MATKIAVATPDPKPVPATASRETIERKTITIPAAGQALGISRNAAYEAARRGEIPTIRIGRLLLVPKVAFERMLRERRRSRPLARSGRWQRRGKSARRASPHNVTQPKTKTESQHDRL